MTRETAPKGRPAAAAHHLSTPTALLQAEAHAREAGRLVEHAAVQRPDLDRTAKLAYHLAGRIRGDRLQVRTARVEVAA